MTAIVKSQTHSQRTEEVNVPFYKLKEKEGGAVPQLCLSKSGFNVRPTEVQLKTRTRKPRTPMRSRASQRLYYLNRLY